MVIFSRLNYPNFHPHNEILLPGIDEYRQISGYLGGAC